MFTNDMNDELLGWLVHTSGQPGQLLYLYCPLDLYETWDRYLDLTFLFEVVYIVLCNDEGTILRPIVFVELDNLATHHNYLEAC